MLIDSHCHLDFDVFDGDRDETIDRAVEAGVGRMVTICTKLEEFPRVRAIARSGRPVDCTVGVHPHHVAVEGVAPVETLVGAGQCPEVVGIGETGLDYHYERSPRDAQRRSFRNHIAAAREAGLPVVVHSRKADAETIEILGEEMARGRFGGVIHCFSSGRRLAEEAVALGLYISFSGILTFRNSEELRAVARDLPMDRILVETDAPFLAPAPNRGKRNEPSFVVHTARTLAGIRGLDVAETNRRTTDNFFRLFEKARERAAPCG